MKNTEISVLEAIKKHPIHSLLFLLSWVGFFVLSMIKKSPFDIGYVGMCLFFIALITSYLFIANDKLNNVKKTTN